MVAKWGGAAVLLAARVRDSRDWSAGYHLRLVPSVPAVHARPRVVHVVRQADRVWRGARRSRPAGWRPCRHRRLLRHGHELQLHAGRVGLEQPCPLRSRHLPGAGLESGRVLGPRSLAAADPWYPLAAGRPPRRSANRERACAGESSPPAWLARNPRRDRDPSSRSRSPDQSTKNRYRNTEEIMSAVMG